MRNNRGITLVEVMIATVLTAAVVLGIMRYFARLGPMLQRTRVRQQIQSQGRMCVDTITQRLRNGKARTLVVSASPGAPGVPESQAVFNLQVPLASGATAYVIYLDGTKVMAQELGPTTYSPRVIGTSVTQLTFTSNVTNPGAVGVTLRMDMPYEGNDMSKVSTLILTNQIVHMVETQ